MDRKTSSLSINLKKTEQIDLTSRIVLKLLFSRKLRKNYIKNKFEI